MKKALLVLTLLLFSVNAEAANRYAVAAGGNWTADATWSTTDGGAPDTVAPTASDDVFLTSNSGNVTISATSVGKSLNCTGYTGTLTHNAFTLTISGSVTLVAGMTYTPASTSARIIIAATGTLTSGGKLPWVVTQQGSATVTLGDNLSFIAQKTAEYQISSGSLNLNGFTLSGNSATNRVLVKTVTLGSVSTITNTTGTFANADFRDITFSSVADYSAITGLSGDCGGNTNGTFTTAATQTWDGTTGNWSTSARWTSRVPLPQDDVNVAASSAGTLTADMPRLGKSIDFTGGGGLTLAQNSIENTSYGSLTLISGMTLTSNQNWNFQGRGVFTLTSAGKVFGGQTRFQAVGGTYTLQDAYTNTSNFVFENGTFTANGFNLTCVNFNMAASNATAVLNMGSGTWTSTATSGGSFSIGSSSTVNASTSTVLISDTGASTKTFAGSGKTYNNLSISGGGAGAVIISGSNTFRDIYMNPAVAGTKSIQLTSGTTQIILNGSQGFGNGTNLWTFTETGGTDPIISKSAGVFRGTSLSLTAIDASTGALFYAGQTPPSVDGGGNANWIFTQAPIFGSGDLSSGTIDDDEMDVYNL